MAAANASVEVDARSKFAANQNVRIKRLAVFSVGEWPRDPNHAIVV